MPYGVKFKIREWSTNQKSGIYKLAGIYETGVVNGFNYDNHVTTDKHIPIIRPLSDLTKECVQADYNNGEPFVPIEVIGKLYETNGIFKDGLFGWDCATGGDDYQDYY